MSVITLEQVEVLAATLEAEQAGKRERLLRLIRAEARIVAVREPEQFKARALEYGDEDGHYDNSYPPDMRYANKNGPKLIRVAQPEWDAVATEGGFYHEWKAVSSTKGLYVDTKGHLWGCTYSGTGSFGQFAAHPGNCGVALSLEWDTLDVDDVSDADLLMCEETLRALAFPMVAEKAEVPV